VTSLPHTATELSERYRHRGDFEVDIRNLKFVLNTERIQARNVEMFHKDLLTSLGGLQPGDAIPPPSRHAHRRTSTPHELQKKLDHIPQSSSGWQAKYRQALLMATQDKLPNRPGRSFTREAYTRRPKSNQSQKRTPKHPDPKPDS